MRICRFRSGSILRKFLIVLVSLSLVSFWILVYHASSDLKPVKRTPVFLEEQCYHPRFGSSSGSREFQELGHNATRKLEKRILVAIRQTSVTFRTEIAQLLEANRIPHQFVYLEIGDKTVFPELTHEGIGRFSAVIFESIKFYVSLGKANRQLIDQYCRQFAIGIVLMAEQENYGLNVHTFGELHLGIKTGFSDLQNVELNPSACLLRLTRAGGIIDKPPKIKWNALFPNHSTYEVVEFAMQEIATTTLRTSDQDKPPDTFENAVFQDKVTSTKHITVLTDLGHLDGIRRVYFGGGLSFWLHRLLFIDALAFLSRGLFAHSLERRILVDIDDIFVGKTGTRMTKEDVQVCFVEKFKYLFFYFPGLLVCPKESQRFQFFISTAILSELRYIFSLYSSVMLIVHYTKLHSSLKLVSHTSMIAVQILLNLSRWHGQQHFLKEQIS